MNNVFFLHIKYQEDFDSSFHDLCKLMITNRRLKEYLEWERLDLLLRRLASFLKHKVNNYELQLLKYCKFFLNYSKNSKLTKL